MWWRRIPETEARQPRQPGPDDRPDPRLTPGTPVRVRSAPGRVRRVIRNEWHYYRQQFVYIVETSAPTPFEPYWFEEQLEVTS